MVQQNEIAPADLVYSENGAAWVQVRNDPILGTLFNSTNGPRFSRRRPSPDARRTWRLPLGLLFAIPIAAAMGWIAWPYYAAYALATAVRDGDISVLESGIDWASVREGLRNDLNAMLLQRLNAEATPNSNKTGAALAAGFAAVLGPTIINQMVNSYVTPQAIATLARTNRTDATPKETFAAAPTNLNETIQSARRIRWEQVQYAFFSGGPLTFKVEFLPDHDPPTQHSVSLLFRWDGNWRLIRIILPADAIGNFSAAAKSENGHGSPVVDIPPLALANPPSADAASIQKERAPVEVILVSKGFKDRNIQANDFEDEITISLAITNVTGKDIRAFDGTLKFTDLLDNEIFSSKLAINDPVKTDSTLNWTGTIKYNQFIDSHQQLKNAQQANLKVRFVPRKTLFADGSTKDFNEK